MTLQYLLCLKCRVYTCLQILFQERKLILSVGAGQKVAQCLSLMFPFVDMPNWGFVCSAAAAELGNSHFSLTFFPSTSKKYRTCFEFPKSEEPTSHILIFPSELPVLRNPAACPELADVQQSIPEWQQPSHYGGLLSPFSAAKEIIWSFLPIPQVCG